MATRTPADVVVIGGGVIGLAVAWEAARGGMAVTVADPLPGRGATWAAAGMLAPVGEANFGEDRLTALNLAAASAWPAFARLLEESSGRRVHLVEDGTLLIAVDPSDREATDDLLAYRGTLGLAPRRLTPAQCRASEPLLSPGIRGGADLAEDHQVDNRCLVEALVAACRALGVAFVAEEATEVEIHPGGVTGVVLAESGRRSAGAVVVAAGCRSGRLGGLPDRVAPPVRPVKGLTLRLRVPDGVPTLQRTVRGLVHGRSCYLVPRQDRAVVVGASVEEKGFDLSVQAGAVGDLLDDARRLVPSLEEYELVETTTGLRPGSPDNGPIVGATGISGLVMATGHYRNGILLAPVTAIEVARLLRTSTSGDRPPAAGAAGADPVDHRGVFAPFGPDRFASPAGGRRPAARPTVARAAAVPP
jgi:glycine oxidase